MFKILTLAFLLSPLACMGYTVPFAGEGYDGPTNPQPNQDQAVHIIWDLTYGLPDMAPPPILWHFGDNCVDGRGLAFASGPKYGTPSAYKNPHFDLCVYGAYESSGWVETSDYDAPNRLDVEWHGTFSDSQTFAHELCHAFKQYLTGDGDPNHTSDCFVGTDGAPYTLADVHAGSLVATANAALIAASL